MGVILKKNLWIGTGWLSKKFHIQGVTVFQERDYAIQYVEFLKNRYKK